MQDNKITIVGMADIKIDSAPITLRTNLGSCIAICLFDRIKKVGGMLHYMLGSASILNNNRPHVLKKAKYADTGVEELLLLLNQQYSVNPRDLVAKVFGGANVLSTCTLDIGNLNQRAAKEVLAKQNIQIVSSKLGGNKGYKLDFCLETGKVKCQTFGEEEEEF